jgi:hypothetical protein
MTQESQMPQPTVAAGTRANNKGRLPGLLPALGVAILAGIGCWMWLSSEGAPAGGARGATATSELAEVNDQELPAAVATLVPSPTFRGQFTDKKSGCPQPLAWVSLASPPEQSGVKVKLKSGNYFSPTYTLSATPMRVAIPFPSPYETGRGTLTVLHDSGGAIVALQPAWRTPAQAGEGVRVVTWRTSNRCKKPNG